MPPNEFSNRIPRWVYRNHNSAVVHLEFVPDPFLVLHRWNIVHPIAALGAQGLREHGRRAELAARTKLCTGFFIATDLDPNGYHILTSAHVLDPVFSAAMPITTELVNQLYHPRLLCGHHEQNYLDNAEAGAVRNPILGMAYRISCENDMLLLRFTRVHMRAHCDHNHRELMFAFQFPTPFKKVMMISWPGRGRRWVGVVGTVSQENRQIADLGGHNTHGFTTQLSEVDITSEGGSSGAPLLNRHGHVIGLLHGGNKRFSYFVGFTELIQTLTAWGKPA